MQYRTVRDEIFHLRALGLTLEQIALVVGVSRQRVHQILERARRGALDGDRWPDPARHPIVLLARAAGGVRAFCRAAGVSVSTYEWARHGRVPRPDTWERLRAAADRISAPAEVREAYIRWVESVRPLRLAHTVVTVPVARGADAAMLRPLAIEAARRAVEDLRAGRPLRSPAPWAVYAASRVAVRITLAREDMELLRRACEAEGRTLSSVVAAYLDLDLNAVRRREKEDDATSRVRAELKR